MFACVCGGGCDVLRVESDCDEAGGETEYGLRMSWAVWEVVEWQQ